MSDVENEIRRMKIALGVELDRDLAHDLNIDPTAVAAWRRRGKIPEKYNVRFKLNRDEWQVKSSGNYASGLREVYVFSLIATASVLIDQQGWFLAEEKESIQQALMGQRLIHLHAYLCRSLPIGADNATLRKSYEKLRKAMVDADIVEWLDALPTD